MVYARLDKKMEAEPHRKDALKLRVELLQVEPSNLTRQAAYLLALAHAGKHAEAAGSAAKVRPRMTQSTEPAIATGALLGRLPPQDSAKKAAYLAQALDALESATKEDYKNLVMLQTDPALEPLRANPRFVEIVKTVQSR